MTEKKILLAKGESIVAVVPEYASGPGWSNQVLWVHIVDATHKYRLEALQMDEQTEDMRVLFHVCHAAHWSMLKAVHDIVQHAGEEK